MLEGSPPFLFIFFAVLLEMAAYLEAVVLGLKGVAAELWGDAAVGGVFRDGVKGWRRMLIGSDFGKWAWGVGEGGSLWGLKGHVRSADLTCLVSIIDGNSSPGWGGRGCVGAVRCLRHKC